MIMRLRVWVLSTCIPDESRPCFPCVFISEKDAYDQADQWLREEWAAAAPEDNNGDALPYPGDWYAANTFLGEYRGPKWGKWEITSHSIECTVLSLWRALTARR
jgi:hypothetical protein